MRIQPTALTALAAATLLWPGSAFAKRRAPSPVPSVVSQGVEYRAPLDVEHMGRVQAFELSSGRKLWETKVYHVWIDPLAEEDVQWVFISSMQVQGGKLLVGNENGKSFRLDLKTGRLEGAMRYWVPWFVAGGLLLVLGFRAWIRARKASSVSVRLRCLGGAFLTASLLYLGIYPGLFTIVAIPALPSPILFLVAVVRPSLFQDHQVVRFYLIGCSIAAVLSWLFEFLWLSSLR
jgi:hypothetical protein